MPSTSAPSGGVVDSVAPAATSRTGSTAVNSLLTALAGKQPKSDRSGGHAEHYDPDRACDEYGDAAD